MNLFWTSRNFIEQREKEKVIDHIEEETHKKLSKLKLLEYYLNSCITHGEIVIIIHVSSNLK